MIDPNTPSNAPIVYQTKLASGQIWVSGTFEGFVTPNRTRLHDSLIVIPTDQRAIQGRHRRGAIVAQDVYAVPIDLIMGHLERIAALDPLLKSPEHDMREEHISQILNSLESIAENYVVLV
jgi:hypothetical protein